MPLVRLMVVVAVCWCWLGDGRDGGTAVRICGGCFALFGSTRVVPQICENPQSKPIKFNHIFFSIYWKSPGDVVPNLYADKMHRNIGPNYNRNMFRWLFVHNSSKPICNQSKNIQITSELGSRAIFLDLKKKPSHTFWDPGTAVDWLSLSSELFLLISRN